MVCEKCFNHQFLKDIIRREGTTGNCPYCKSRKVRVVDNLSIAPFIRNISAVYTPIDPFDPLSIGDRIGTLIQEDWDIFSEPISQKQDLLNRLVRDLLYTGVDLSDDHPDYDSDWRRTSDYLEEIWHESAIKLIENGKLIDFASTDRALPNPIEVALEDLAVEVPGNSTFYRVRIHENRYRYQPFEEAELLAPPPDRTPEGRVNRKGQPVLYVATSRETAIAEKRPW